MIYQKNLPGWERAIRAMMGLALIAGGLLGLHGGLTGYGLAAASSTLLRFGTGYSLCELDGGLIVPARLQLTGG
jgi:hypothetical protein